MPSRLNRSIPMPQPRTLRRFLLLLRSNWISSLGAALVFLSVLGTVSAFYMQATGGWAGPYLGIVTTLVLPALFVLGLLLVPFGLLLYRGKLEKRMEELTERPLYLARAIVLLTLVNFAGLALLGYGGVTFMSSNQFCGEVCHEVMEPEYVAYQDSPHANVDCVACHVGPGAESMIRSKINGVHQLIGTITDDYSRPIPTPVHQLRPATETCENCHWPEKYLGTKLVLRNRYRENETNTAFTNVLLMRTGGTGPDGTPTGIHWHTNPQNKVEYVATDYARSDIPWVQVTRPDGSVEVFTREGFEGSEPPQGERRLMDCNDCHNRAAHHFESIADALDRDLAAGLISRRIPLIRRNGREILEQDWSRDNATEGIRGALRERYGDASGQLDPEMEPLLDQATERLSSIWMRNIYPERKLLWDSYPSHKSHDGCYRCHGGQHRSVAAQDRVITNACDKCHVVLSHEESDPPVLQSLGLRAEK